MSVIIRLKNLPMSAGASDVRTFFSGLKIPDGAVHIIGGDEGEVFVGFASDEDARIAMTRDRSIIHGAEIRLLLSSKSEQSAVINARKNGDFTSPKPHEEYVPPAPSQPSQNPTNWNFQPQSNPYAAKSGYEASFPPQNSNTSRADFSSYKTYSNREPLLSPVKPKDTFGGDYGGYKHSNYQQQGPPPQNANRFEHVSHETKPVEPINARPNIPIQHPPSHPPNQSQQFSTERSYSHKEGNNSETIRADTIQGTVSEKQSGGDSWRDNTYNQHPRNNFKGDYSSDRDQYRNDSNDVFNGGKKFNQVPPRLGHPPEVHMPTEARVPPQNGRKTLIPTPQNAPLSSFQNAPPSATFQSGPSKSFQNGPPNNFQTGPPTNFQNGPSNSFQNGPPNKLQTGPPNTFQTGVSNSFQNGLSTTFQNGPSNPFQNAPPVANLAPLNRPFLNHPPSVGNQQRLGPPIFQNGPAAPVMQNTLNQSVPPAVQNRVPPAFQNTMRPPVAAVPNFNQHPPVPIVTPINKQAVITTPVVDKFYIELTRLPNDLLRPAALEAFIHPTTPLTLSSVKTVFGPGGIHMHTIIRLDSIADYATMMRRNGEQGIKIQQSDKNSFDSAVDGIPVPVVLPVVPVDNKREEDESKKNKRSRWETNSGQKSPRRSPSRRDHRDRSRSRSPPRRRRRSRSPRRRDEHTDPTRWSIQVTNVPFRFKEEDLLEWFAEKVRPARLVRTFYSDGNASDRWIAEFSSESLMKRAFSIRSLCSNRTLKLSYIDNDKADEILRIADVYGEEKRSRNENMREEAEKANPPSFFNAPSTAPRVPITPPNMSNGPMGPSLNGPNGPSPPAFNGPPMRGGFAPRGNGFQPARGGMMGRGAHGGPGFYQNGRNDFNNSSEQQGQFGIQGADTFRGGFRGGFRGRGGARDGFPGNFRSNDIQPTRNEFMELVKSIGPRGTVLSCTGFPKDVTLEDVVGFFADYEPDRNSIRIRRGDDGVMTGECMLACFNPENSRRASVDLNGLRLRNCPISVRVV